MTETTEKTIKPVWQVYHDWQRRRRELRVIPALGDDMTPIATYSLPWDDPGNVARDAAIARARVEHDAR
jgi:hypothetical protein